MELPCDLMGSLATEFTPHATICQYWTRVHILPLLLTATVCRGRNRRGAVNFSFGKRMKEQMLGPDAARSWKLGKSYCSSVLSTKHNTCVKLDDKPNLEPKLLHRKNIYKVIHATEASLQGTKLSCMSSLSLLQHKGYAIHPARHMIPQSKDLVSFNSESTATNTVPGTQ